MAREDMIQKLVDEGLAKNRARREPRPSRKILDDPQWVRVQVEKAHFAFLTFLESSENLSRGKAVRLLIEESPRFRKFMKET